MKLGPTCCLCLLGERVRPPGALHEGYILARLGLGHTGLGASVVGLGRGIGCGSAGSTHVVASVGISVAVLRIIAIICLQAVAVCFKHGLALVHRRCVVPWVRSLALTMLWAWRAAVGLSHERGVAVPVEVCKCCSLAHCCDAWSFRMSRLGSGHLLLVVVLLACEAVV
eukprot:16439063-Heterocapsa_arctica.AAC.1